MQAVTVHLLLLLSPSSPIHIITLLLSSSGIDQYEKSIGSVEEKTLRLTRINLIPWIVLCITADVRYILLRLSPQPIHPLSPNSWQLLCCVIVVGGKFVADLFRSSFLLRSGDNTFAELHKVADLKLCWGMRSAKETNVTMLGLETTCDELKRIFFQGVSSEASWEIKYRNGEEIIIVDGVAKGHESTRSRLEWSGGVSEWVHLISAQVGK